MKRSIAQWAVMWAVLLAACGGNGLSDGGHDARSPGGADAGPPDAAPGPEPVKFIVVGDVGTGDSNQQAVADAMEQKCLADGCDFVVMLGDNIYESGVESVDDPQWQSKFEDIYVDMDLPFFAALGNHDYGGEIAFVDMGGVGNEWERGPMEVMYTDVSSKWNMPATHYTFTWGNVGFIMLDTNSLMWDNTDHGDQYQWYPTALMEVSDADWVFAAGHHPYLSNGSHGNVGEYDTIEVGGIEIPVPFDFLNGDDLKIFFDQLMCGTVDIYFAGHDHNRQWLNEPEMCSGTELIVSGAGGKLKDFEGVNEHHWQDDTKHGFMYVVIEGDRFFGQFVDHTGQVDFEREFIRPGSAP